MIKVGNRVSLFDNMGKEGTVIGYQKTKNRNHQWATIPQANFTNNIVIQWDDGTTSVHPVLDVMRID